MAIRHNLNPSELDGPSWIALMWSYMLDYFGGMEGPAAAESFVHKEWEWGNDNNPRFDKWGEVVTPQTQRAYDMFAAPQMSVTETETSPPLP